ncbi:MAG: hypothetical protein B6I28_00240 [Fusobacteriia bacterium 4572_132]|nr:MAG: hypothetical protein B6I28_00240 [Fusobacteriia bacterium 4572_132]
MIKPIDMQVIVKNVDKVIETQKNQSRNVLAQEVNAKKQLKKEVEQNMTIIKEGEKTNDKGIGKNKPEEIKIMREKKEKNKRDKNKREKKSKKKKSMDRNRGKIIDLEG